MHLGVLAGTDRGCEEVESLALPLLYRTLFLFFFRLADKFKRQILLDKPARGVTLRSDHRGVSLAHVH